MQRIAKFTRYLPESGWTPVIIAAELVPGRPLDESLASEVESVRVTRTPARHVATAISRLLRPAKEIANSGARDTVSQAPAPDAATEASPGSPAKPPMGVTPALRKPSLSRRLARWVTVPDDAVFWKGPAITAAVRLGRECGAEAIIATGPPYSVVIAGGKVARHLGVPLVADMRDAWDRNPVAVVPTPLHRAVSRSQEQRSLAAADVVTCTSPAIADEARAFGARHVEIVPNGFDPADLPQPSRDAATPLRIAFMGRIYFGQSDPTPVLEAMAACATDRSPAANIEFDIVGTWPESVEAAVARLGLGDRVHFHGYRPHRDALEIVARADVGLVLVEDLPGAEATAPAKLYEYLGLGMAALVLGPVGGFPARVVAECGGGITLPTSDGPGLAAALRELAAAKASGTLPVPDPHEVARYDRREQARELARVLDAATAERTGADS